MTVKAITPSDAAASPTHPEHARWVKERTLSIEIEHAQKAGGSLRDAEAANIANLARMAGRARFAKPARKAAPAKPKYREVSPEELRAAQVRKRPAKIVPVRKHACGGACGLCLDCKRLARVALIRERLPHEARLQPIVNALTVMTIAFGLQRRFRDMGFEFPFDHPRTSVRNHAHDAAVSQIIDRTVSILGAWR